MTEMVVSGRLIEVILALVAIEAAVLLLWVRATGRGPSPVAILVNLAAGACLMAALRAALVGAEPIHILAPLALALVAHLADLVLRFREAGRHRNASG